MLYGDRPISSPRQDALGRAGFALELARAIDNLNLANDGFVMGLLGDWGSGKSSVIELIVRYLRHIEMMSASNRPILREANAQPRSLDDLEDMSFVYEKIEPRVFAMAQPNRNLTHWERSNRRQEFARWLGSSSEAEIADRYFQLKLDVESRPRNVVVRFSPWLISGKAELAQALLSELARGLGEKLGNEVAASFGTLLKRLSEFAPVAGSGLDAVSGIHFGRLAGTALGTWSGRVAQTMISGPTLEEARERLKTALRQRRDQKVVVIIDDLDRLTPAEAFEMVSLVKTLGDLPNVLYFLSYSHAQLAALIKSAIDLDGHEFLEKIVQYPKHLPPIDEADLSNLLNADLENLLSDVSAEESTRLSEGWYFTFRHYLTTPRHVRRFINAYSVSLSALAGHTNRIDLALLTVLELYEPSVYAWLRSNMDIVAS
jgi:predicted KAP-like P-loop ATPase